MVKGQGEQTTQGGKGEAGREGFKNGRRETGREEGRKCDKAFEKNKTLTGRMKED